MPPCLAHPQPSPPVPEPYQGLGFEPRAEHSGRRTSNIPSWENCYAELRLKHKHGMQQFCKSEFLIQKTRTAGLEHKERSMTMLDISSVDAASSPTDVSNMMEKTLVYCDLQHA